MWSVLTTFTAPTPGQVTTRSHLRLTQKPPDWTFNFHFAPLQLLLKQPEKHCSIINLDHVKALLHALRWLSNLHLQLTLWIKYTLNIYNLGGVPPLWPHALPLSIGQIANNGYNALQFVPSRSTVNASPLELGLTMRLALTKRTWQKCLAIWTSIQ